MYDYNVLNSPKVSDSDSQARGSNFFLSVMHDVIAKLGGRNLQESRQGDLWIDLLYRIL